uniref:Uncharacterized protein n=1 Tax=Ditylenchus dipsaci TaxID=166011 RepID=A0A915EJC5_9BILA
MFRHNVYSLQYQGCKDGNKYYAPNTIAKIVLPTVDKSEGYALFCQSEPDNNFIAAYKVLPCCFLDGKVKKLGCQYRKSKPIVLAGDKVMIDEETMLHCERFASGYFVTYNPAKCEDDLRNELSYGSVYEGSTGLYRCSGKSIGLARGTLKVTNCVYSGLFIPLNQCVHIGRGVYYRCLEDVYGQPQWTNRLLTKIVDMNSEVLEKSSLAPLLPKHKVFLSTRTEETIERYERIREKDYYLEDDYYEEIIIHRHHGKGRSKHNSTTSTSSSSGGSSSKEDRESDSQESDEECSYDDEEGGRRESIDSEEDSSSSSQRTSDSTEEIIDETIIDGKGKARERQRTWKTWRGRRSSQRSSGGDDVHSHGQGPGTGSSSEDDGDSHGSGGSHENGEPRGKSGGEGSTETFQGGGKSGGDCDQVRGGGNDGDDDNDSSGTSGSGDGGSSSTESGGDDHSPEDDKIKPHGDDDISYCSGETGGSSGGMEMVVERVVAEGKEDDIHGEGTSSESRENRGTPVILPPTKSSSSEEYGTLSLRPSILIRAVNRNHQIF